MPLDEEALRNQLTQNAKNVGQLEAKCKQLTKNLQMLNETLAAKEDLMRQIVKEAEDRARSSLKNELDWQTKQEQLIYEVKILHC